MSTKTLKQSLDNLHEACIQVIATIMRDRFYDPKNEVVFVESTPEKLDITQTFELTFQKGCQNLPVFYRQENGENVLTLVRKTDWGNDIIPDEPNFLSELLGQFDVELYYTENGFEVMFVSEHHLPGFTQEDFLKYDVNLSYVVSVLRTAYALDQEVSEQTAAEIIFPDFSE